MLRQAHPSVQNNLNHGHGLPSRNYLRVNILRFLPRTGGASLRRYLLSGPRDRLYTI
jgi:hypothetical protein